MWHLCTVYLIQPDVAISNHAVVHLAIHGHTALCKKTQIVQFQSCMYFSNCNANMLCKHTVNSKLLNESDWTIS